MKTITAQDFSTTELIEALAARGYGVDASRGEQAMIAADAIAAERERAAAELAAMRARTIEECARFVEGAERLRWSLDIAADMRVALAAPAPTTEPAPVDPAAGALR